MSIMSIMPIISEWFRFVVSGRLYNSKGVRVNYNNILSLCHLPLANQVPAMTRDSGTEKSFDTALNLSKGYTLITLILNGCKMPVEKQRDSVTQMIVLHTVAPYCLSKETRPWISS